MDRSGISESAGWPGQAATTHDMNVQMKDSLATVAACINDCSVSVRESQLSRNLWDLQQQMSGQRGV